jgi:hypothetical protein
MLELVRCRTLGESRLVRQCLVDALRPTDTLTRDMLRYPYFFGGLDGSIAIENPTGCCEFQTIPYTGHASGFQHSMVQL